jgi:hypothetical protein
VKSSVCRETRQPIRFAAERYLRGLFPCPRHRRLPRPFPRLLTRFKPFGLALLQSSFTQIAPSIFRLMGAYPGLVSTSRHHRCASTVRKTPEVLLCSVLRFSQPSDGLLRTPASQTCFILQATFWILSSVRGFVPSAKLVLLSKNALPPCRCAFSAHEQARCHTQYPRLRGLHLLTKSGAKVPVLPVAPAHSPLGFLLLQVRFLGSELSSLRSNTLNVDNLRVHARPVVRSQRISIRESWLFCLQSCPPAQAFWPRP